jgi:hypothetical protein
MKRRITTFIVAGVIPFAAVTGGYAVGYADGGKSSPQTCEAPCTVVFPAGMEEDEFQIDYAQERLTVWREKGN